MLTGCDVVLCNRPDDAKPADIEFSNKSRLVKSSKLFAATKRKIQNINQTFELIVVDHLQYLSNEPIFCKLNVKHIRFLCSFSNGPICGSFSIDINCNLIEEE